MPRFVKINFDRSLYNDLAAGGYIIQDWKGKVVKVGSAYDDQTSIITEESQPLRDDVQETISGLQ